MGSDADDANTAPQAVADARADWKSSTTALERVQQVIEQTTTPKTAGEVAEEALVSEPTARKHLKSLVEVGTAAATEESGATKYARNEDTLLYQRIRELATEHSREELIESIQEMKHRITGFEDEYDAASPEDLATSLESDAPEGAWEAVSEWQTTERNLHIAQAAINYGRARDLGAATQ
ncbi:winged helix-turn-helix transcriptional regulator [Halarchaeum sp. CBA1220]|uniref:winged helix-turn-helix domain-containing protein n=1 Tax=Halarchaeum sp. CBA1220 TaxID=1853682 RepID=UPI000F3A85A3|nr:winged helix-turn-helix domain-containing protein [Halarchaeum sp. CBA1220]QLC34364.1 winged helix-turn-helix transcriptional regulator [Halarchaeum sp. CBA1220]